MTRGTLVGQRAWIRTAMERLAADYSRSADTHLIRLDARRASDVPIYLKDESAHPRAASSTGWRDPCSCTASSTA